MSSAAQDRRELCVLTGEPCECLIGGVAEAHCLAEKSYTAHTVPRYDEYKLAVHRALGENPEWRYGQACFNVLTEFDPDLAERIRGSDYDPFYSDGRLPGFFFQLQVAWSK